MRVIKKVIILVDGDNPQADLDTIIEDGADAEGFSKEEWTVSEELGQAYWKLVKS